MQNNNLAEVENCSLAFGLVSLGYELLQFTCEVDHCSLASNYIDISVSPVTNLVNTNFYVSMKYFCVIIS
jgi:hypothetical protein